MWLSDAESKLDDANLFGLKILIEENFIHLINEL